VLHSRSPYATRSSKRSLLLLREGRNSADFVSVERATFVGAASGKLSTTSYRAAATGDLAVSVT
jgi:hypothetical protein